MQTNIAFAFSLIHLKAFSKHKLNLNVKYLENYSIVYFVLAKIGLVDILGQSLI